MGHNGTSESREVTRGERSTARFARVLKKVVADTTESVEEHTDLLKRRRREKDSSKGTSNGVMTNSFDLKGQKGGQRKGGSQGLQKEATCT